MKYLSINTLIDALSSELKHGRNLVYRKEQDRWINVDITWGSANKFKYNEFTYYKSSYRWFDLFTTRSFILLPPLTQILPPSHSIFNSKHKNYNSINF